MKLPLTSLLLITSTVLLCYLIPVGSAVLRPFFFHSFQIKSDTELQAIMPAATRFIADHAWLFVAATGGVGALGFVLSLFVRLVSDRIVVLALCVQGLVAWIAFFCAFYSAFLRFSLHSGYNFEWDYFFTVGAGVFPVTLSAILLPFCRACLPPRPVAGA